MVAFDINTGAQLWLAQGDGDVTDVAYMGGVVYAGGHFDNMSGQPRGRLAAFNPITGALRADWTPTVNTSIAVVAMIAAGNKLYVGGGFTIVTGVNQQRYAVFSGAPPANTPPVVDSVVIDQSSPQTNATLSATVAAHDADGDPLTLGYQWTRNGTDIAGATAAVLDMSVAGRGDKGDLIRLRVTANDGTANSSPLTSSPVTVGNTAPSATVALDSHTPGTSAVLQASAVSADADSDPVSFTYVWTVNGTVKRTTTTSATTDSLDLSVAGNGDPNDVIVVTVTPNDGATNGSPVSDTATVSSGAAPPIFTDDFSSGDFVNWTSNTRLTIDNATGSPAAPSARAQVTNQSASAYKDLASPVMTACTSLNVNVIAGSNIDLFRLRTAANGALIKVLVATNGTLQIRSDFAGTSFSSGVQMGTGFHSVELCGTVGTNTTWDLYRDGVKIVNAWATNTGTTGIGRVQIGDTAAKTFTVNYDNVRMDMAPGENQAPDTTPPTIPGQPSGTSPSVGTIQIAWSASTDASPPITYRVYRDGGSTPIGSTTSTTFTDPGLTPGTTHTYTVDAVDSLANPSAKSVASAPILVTSAASAIFADDFSTGDFANWTSNTRLTIDNTTGSPTAPSARAQVTSQSASAYKDLASPVMTACTSLSVNVTAGTNIDLFRLRTAANGAIVKVFVGSNGTLQIRSDFAGTSFSSGVQMGTGFHSVELCGTVGTTSTWNLYRDGVQIVTNWAADTGTTAIGRVQIGDTAAKTFTVNYDNVRMDTAVGG